MIITEYNISIGSATHTGKVRELNEDSMAHFDTPIGYCIIVCDGMGGHAAGDVASQNAVNSIQQFLQDSNNMLPVILAVLKNAVEFANFHLREMITASPALKGMGTTLVLALIKDGQLYTAHAGDSRIYLLQNGGIEQITKDHSPVQKLIDIGVLTEEEAELSDKKNQISKAIGIFEKVEPSVTATPIRMQHNDTIVLCSDGLTGHVNKMKIAEIVASTADIEEAALQLIAEANEGGGSDNITVQLVHYSGNPTAIKKKRPLKRIITILIVLIVIAAVLFWGYNKYYTKHQTQPSKDSTSSQQ